MSYKVVVVRSKIFTDFHPPSQLKLLKGTLTIEIMYEKSQKPHSLPVLPPPSLPVPPPSTLTQGTGELRGA